MTKYLISFHDEAMVVPDAEFEAVLVASDGALREGTYPGHKVPNGGYLILGLPTGEGTSRRRALAFPGPRKGPNHCGR
ncbi:hypothetical protein SAMN04489740_0471 [Arthrobacter alpinus]|uniref:YCII-related domain-containing protein n=1 Tax=Arthrobacter alpinus TaxID=656366 RepID=A0A1H5FBI2_9MICC|nr:hypothetical protein SAMN04489740_0471 [Arthrobacter alpinus]